MAFSYLEREKIYKYCISQNLVIYQKQSCISCVFFTFLSLLFVFHFLEFKVFKIKNKNYTNKVKTRIIIKIFLIKKI